MFTVCPKSNEALVLTWLEEIGWNSRVLLCSHSPVVLALRRQRQEDPGEVAEG